MASSTNTSYDVIIVGAGTAGCVLANRLTELPHLNVLLIEAGQNLNDDPLIATPGFAGQSFGNDKYDWKYKTVPQEALGGRVLEQVRGRMLGGSSAINVLMCTYPSRKVFDVWEQYGNSGWGAAAMEPYLQKWENSQPPPQETVDELGLSTYLDASLASANGPVSTTLAKWTMPFSRIWMETMDSLGLKNKADPRTGEASGAFMTPSFVDQVSATRSHAGVAYWQPASGRPNLHTVLGATVNRVLIDKGGDGALVAQGVEYTIEGVKHVARAEKEIILSAGGYGSPALLEMSGIGSPQVLEPLGIDVLLDNANVGENLQDHTILFVSQEVEDASNSLDSLKLPGRFEQAMQQYMEQKSGPLSAGFMNLGTLPATTGMSESETKVFFEDVESHLTSAGLSQAEKIRAQYFANVVRSEHEPTIYISPQPFAGLGTSGTDDFFGVSAVVSSLSPFSKGSTHIQSTDPNTSPLIDPGFLTNELDVEICARGVLFATNTIFKTPPFKDMLKDGGKTTPPSGAPTTLEDAKAWVKTGSASFNHVVGTCAMMSRDLGGVVDERLRVHGVKGLRVCDASVFPVIPKGPVTSSVYAVAERGADLIKEDLV
jgi:choline dehydrogenase-like flavoprotein